MNRAQRELLQIAQQQGWIRPTSANDLRTARVLIQRGLLEPHPDYEGGTILRPSAEPTTDAGGSIS